MNQHLGATYTLSVAIVIAFAIALHRPDPPSRARPPVEAKPPAAPPPAVVPVARTTVPSTAPSKVRTVSRVTATSPRPQAPRGAFTTVERGETLADVARRVYGPSLSAADVWRANRDQLATIETPPREGMLLRTP